MMSLLDSGERVKKSKPRNSLPNFSGAQLKSLFKSGGSGRASRRKSSTRQTCGSVCEKVEDCVKCPECEFVTDINAGSINRLPRHLLLQKKLHIELNKIQDDALALVWCGLCSEEQMVYFELILLLFQTYSFANLGSSVVYL